MGSAKVDGKSFEAEGDHIVVSMTRVPFLPISDGRFLVDTRLTDLPGSSVRPGYGWLSE